MSEVTVNWSGCVVTRSHMTGDIVCQLPGPECDCLISANPPDESYATYLEQPND
jgi:hypothetical protein